MMCVEHEMCAWSVKGYKVCVRDVSVEGEVCEYGG